MDRLEKSTGVAVPALVAPQPGQAAGGPQFPQPGALAARRREAALQAGLGLGRVGKTAVYVSSGTGYWGPPMRLAAPAEITKIVLESASAASQST